MGISNEQISNLINEAQNSLQNASQTSQNLSGMLKEQLTSSVGGLQDYLNGLLKKGGVVSEQQYNYLDEQTRLLKLKTLEAESMYTSQRFAIYVGVGVALIGLVWYLSRS